MIYAPISREHQGYMLAHTGTVKHTNKKVRKETWAYYFPSNKNGDAFSGHLPKGTKDELMWVCYDGGRVIGIFLLSVNEQDEIIHPMLIVHEDYRNRGVGSSLSRLAVASFKGTYGDKPINIKVSNQNKAFGILSRIGFKQIGVDKIPVLDMNGEPTRFKEIAILEI